MQTKKELRGIIENEQIEEREKQLLSFFLSQLNHMKHDILYQINNSNVSHDFSPYYDMLVFNPIENQIKKTSISNCDLVIQVLHENVGPTVFRLLISNGFIHFFEVYNADFHCLKYDELCKGKIYKEF